MFSIAKLQRLPHGLNFQAALCSIIPFTDEAGLPWYMHREIILKRIDSVKNRIRKRTSKIIRKRGWVAFTVICIHMQVHFIRLQFLLIDEDIFVLSGAFTPITKENWWLQNTNVKQA